jgi:hypothetical protein
MLEIDSIEFDDKKRNNYSLNNFKMPEGARDIC